MIYCEKNITASELSKEIYGEHSEETELLRYFRDNVLTPSPAGKERIMLYYQWSHAIVQAMNGDKEFKNEVEDMIDEVLMMMR